MIEEIIYKILFFILFFVFILIRQYYSKKYTVNQSLIDVYPLIIKVILLLCALTIVIAPIVYCLTPFLDQFYFTLPDEVRIIGIVLLLVSVICMWWILLNLKNNFNQDSDSRYLVITGPYKVVRHPMYTIFIIQSISQAMLSANVILLSGIIFTFLVMVLRVKFEDEILIEEFGDEYKKYKASKQALIPKIW